MDRAVIDKKFLDLDHRFLKLFKENGISGVTVAVAHSGGVDSTALFALVCRLSQPLNIKVICFHIHHGPTDSNQFEFRNSALKCVTEQSELFGVPIYSLSSVQALASEADCRDLRLFAFDQWRECADYVAMAHHQQDQLETRLLRLIRGCGPEGLQAMTFLSGSKLRPFIDEQKIDLIKYCEELNLMWVEDPSNSEVDYLRNWVRQSWLPALEEQVPGGVNRLHNSLAIVAQATDPYQLPEALFADDKSLILSEFLTLNMTQKKQALAQFMKINKMKNYSQNHIHEALKRLDSLKNEDRFTMLRCTWSVNAGRITVEPT